MHNGSNRKRSNRDRNLIRTHNQIFTLILINEFLCVVRYVFRSLFFLILENFHLQTHIFVQLLILFFSCLTAFFFHFQITFLIFLSFDRYECFIVDHPNSILANGNNHNNNNKIIISFCFSPDISVNCRS